MNKESSKRIKIAFVSPVVSSIFSKDVRAKKNPPKYSPFIQKDLNILRKHFDVKVVGYSGIKHWHTFFPKLLWSIMTSDLTFSWFGDIYSFYATLLSKMFGKKSIVVVGGHDAYEIANKGRKHSYYLKFTYRFSDRVLVVDESLKKDIIRNTGLNGKNIQTIHTSYDPNQWKPKGGKDKKMVLTVGNISSSSIERKGLDIFVKTAKYLPEMNFVLIGAHIDSTIRDLRFVAPLNVKFRGFVPYEKLDKYYRKAKVYVQVSSYEGLPNSLCEAMLCECVPVGTKVYGIPTAIGNTGIYVPYGDPEATAEAIKKAMTMDGNKARERIKNMFPLKKRELMLMKVVEKLVVP